MGALVVTPGRRPGERIYSVLVENEDDVVGFVAYALYKQDKLAFIESKPDATDADVAAYCHGVRLPSSVETYRERAATVLGTMQEQLYSEQAQMLASEYQADLVAAVKKLPKHRPVKDFFYHLFQHIVGSLFATFLAVMVVLAVLGWKQGVQKTLMQLMENELMKKEPAGGAPQGADSTAPAAPASVPSKGGRTGG